MAWTIKYTETARESLRRLDRQVARRVLDYMDVRVAGHADPRSLGSALTGPLLGSYWRYRMGDIRIICDLQDSVLVILVIEIGNRKDVYRK